MKEEKQVKYHRVSDRETYKEIFGCIISEVYTFQQLSKAAPQKKLVKYFLKATFFLSLFNHKLTNLSPQLNFTLLIVPCVIYFNHLHLLLRYLVVKYFHIH